MADVLLIDSGVGSLSISQAIYQHMPQVNQRCVLDTAFFPYGQKNELQVLSRVLAIVEQQLQHFSPDAVVIACNTASTLVLPELRQRYSTPFIGVVPAIKPAAQLSQTGTIALIATQGTVDREYTQTLINDFAPNCQVIKVAASSLVALSEQSLRNKPVTHEDCRLALRFLFEHPDFASIDTAILGCTHFPLLKPVLTPLFPSQWQWVDASEAIARRLSSVLNEQGIKFNEPKCSEGGVNISANGSRHAILTSKDTSLKEGLVRYGFSSIEMMD